MKSSEDYILSSKLLVDMLHKEKPEIVIFGAQGMGVVMLNAFKSLNIFVTCFCDNSPPDSGNCYGLPCLKPFEAVRKYPNAIYIFSAIEPKTCHIMKKDLLSLNCNVQGYYWDIIYYALITSRRKVNEVLFADALYSFWGADSDQKLTIHSLSFRITSRCSLRCKECAFLLPYQPKHDDFPLDELLFSLKDLCNMTDGILDLTVNGGETFLYSELASLIREITGISNIINIVIATNGTIVPSDEIMKLCADNAIRIRISNYGVYSNKIDLLRKKCADFDVSVYDFHRVNKWHKIGTTKHNRTDDENRVIADNCCFNGGKNKRILGLYNGDLHLCDRFDGLFACGLISGNYYDDLHYNLKTGNRESLCKFLQGETLYKLCDMCDYPMNEIPPGIQLEN